MQTAEARYARNRARATIAAFLLMVSASCGQAFGFLVVAGSARFGVATSSFLIWTTIWLLGGALALPWVGHLISRIGVRTVAIVSGIVASGCIAAMAFAHDIVVLYALSALLSVPWVGCTIVASTTLATGWHQHRRKGVVVGLVATGSGVGGVLWGVFMPFVVGLGGYQAGMLAISGVRFVIVVCLGSVFITKPPIATPTPIRPARSVTRVSGALVLLTLRGFLGGLDLVFSAILPTILIASIDDAAGAGQIFATYSIVAIVVAPILGLIHDRFGFRALLVVLMCGELLIFPIVAGAATTMPALLYPFVPLAAFVLSAPFVVLPLAVSRSVHPSNYAFAFSVALAGTTAGLAIGAPLWGLIFDVAGNFTPALWAAGLLGALSIAVIGLGTRQARPRGWLSVPTSPLDDPCDRLGLSEGRN